MSGDYPLAKLADDLPKLMAVADALGQSGMFDVKSPQQALVKLLTGAELGMTPAQAMRLVHVVEGKPMVGAQVYSTKLRQHKVYDYRVIEASDEVCAIEFTRKRGRGAPEVLGVYRVTIEKAHALGWTVSRNGTPKANWARHPDAMLFARAISQGVRIYCPDVMQGFYVDGEIEPDGDVITIKAEVVDAQARDDGEGRCPATGGMHCWGDAEGGTGCVANREVCDAMQAWSAGTPGDMAPEQTEADPVAGECPAAGPTAPGSGAVGETGGGVGTPPPEGTPCAHLSWSPCADGIACDDCGAVRPDDEPPEAEDPRASVRLGGES